METQRNILAQKYGALIAFTVAALFFAGCNSTLNSDKDPTGGGFEVESQLTEDLGRPQAEKDTVPLTILVGSDVESDSIRQIGELAGNEYFVGDTGGEDPQYCVITVSQKNAQEFSITCTSGPWIKSGSQELGDIYFSPSRSSKGPKWQKLAPYLLVDENSIPKQVSLE